MPIRWRNEYHGSGFFGDSTQYDTHTGLPIEDSVVQTGGPYFPNITHFWDVIGEHFGDFGAELDHPLYVERLTSGDSPTIHATFEGADVRTVIRGWIPEPLRAQLEFLQIREDWDESVYADPDFWENVGDLDGPWPSFLEHLDVSSLLVPVNTLLSRTNPSKPSTDVPSFMWEGLRGMPDLVRLRGNSLLGAAGSANLQWQFGWKPLLADLKNLIDFGTQVSKKLAIIQKLVRGMYKTKSRVEKVSDDSEETIPFGFDEFPFSLDEPEIVKLTRTTTLDRWGSVTYRLTASEVESFRRYSAEEQNWLSIQAAYGLHAGNPASLWEIIPWSWLVDWFLPVQDLLDRYNNLIPVEVANLNLMTTTKTLCTFENVGSGMFAGVASPLTILRTTLERNVLAPDGSLPIVAPGRPILDVRKLGILTSLRAQRRR